MHGNSTDRRALEREALRNVINQWNANRLDLFELSEPNEDLEFHGVMRFYFQDSGQKVATKCIRVASDATVEDVIGTLVEKFRPDMRMLSVPSYALYELHEGCPERRMEPDEKPLLVQLNWHVDDREGRFLLKNIDDKTVNYVGSIDSNASFRRKLSKREKKQLKKQEKLSRMKSENGDINDKDGVAEKLYTELPETLFTRSISNPEAVMRRRRQQKLEKKLQQFRSKDGGPDTGGTLKIYGEALCKDVPYKTLLLSIRDCAGAVVKEMLDKYGLTKTDPSQWCLVQVTQQSSGPDIEYVLDDDECPLAILMNAPNTGSIMFHVRRRPADCAPRKRKKKPGALGGNAGNTRDVRGETAPLLVELGPDGSTPHPSDTARTIRLTSDVMEVGSANGIALQLYGPHIQPRHCVISNSEGVTSLTPCHADAHTYVNGQRIHQTTILTHGSLVKFGHSNTYRFLDPSQEERTRHPGFDSGRIYDSRSPRALSPTEPHREHIVETTFDLEGNVETVSTASGAREDNRSLGSSTENRLSGMDRCPRGQDPILPAVLEFPEEPQEQFLARVITHLDVTTPTFRLAPAYTLYLCARYRASTHYRPELTPTERAHKLTLLLQHAAMLIRHTVQDRSTESTSQAFWLANASELLHFLKSDRHVSAFSLQAQDTLADAVQLAFKNLVACLTDELNSVMSSLMSLTGDDNPREIINILSGAMNLLRKCRVNAALTIQLFSQLFHWISAKALSTVISNSTLCTRAFGIKLSNRLRNLQAWAESQGLELAAECHLAKIVQCAHLLQAPKSTPEELASLSSACFKLNSMQLGALLMQYKAEPVEKLASQSLLEQAAKAAESVADELARAEGREVTLYEDPAPPLQLLLPDDGFSCDVVQGVPPGLADFLHPLQASGLCRLAAQPTSSGHWTVYMTAPRPPSALSATQPEVQVIRLHKAGGGMGLSIVAAKGTGQERLGIYIKSVVPGGAADRDGRLAAGDQLLAVDGQSLLGITQEKAAEFLVRTGSVVTLEVAKGGAVYHGLATALLQQPSPTPHRALDYYYYDQGSQESLYSLSNQRLFTPPATKPKNNVFFNSDDNLYKTETRKLTIPRIEIECEPVFNLHVTDYSETSPKNVILSYDETGTNLKMDSVEDLPPLDPKPSKSWKDRTSRFMQQKSYSIEVHENPFVDIDEVSDTDKFLSIGSKKLRQQRLASTSLQDLSSSTSSINSGIHESNFDLSQIDPDTPIKHWKSPDEMRNGPFVIDGKQYDTKAISVPELSRKKRVYSRSKSVSEENLNNRLTEYERLEILKLLYDWSLNGSDSKSDFNWRGEPEQSENIEEPGEKPQWRENFNNTNLKQCSMKFCSEPDLSPKIKNKLQEEENSIYVTKYNSDGNVSVNNTLMLDFSHICEFRNCIFNIDFMPKNGTKDNPKDYISNNLEDNVITSNAPKSILKNSKEKLNESECLINITNLQKPPKVDKISRRNSEIIESKSFNSRLVRCDSLERLTHLQKNYRNKQTQGEFKKFPESYIVTKRSTCHKGPAKTKNSENSNKIQPKQQKVIVLKKKYVPKAWKSCSDIKIKPKAVRKCCRFAKKSCPVLKDSSQVPRKAQSCVNIEEDAVEYSARLAALKDLHLRAFNCPRRMSERDLPSRVDSERTIPSSKSVPALHHISPNSEHPRSSHDVFNPGYSRTSSNNSINMNNAPHPATLNGTAGNPAAATSLRSRSTHNLHQQDAGFYQNLSVYRNKVPSPQHLGDRTSALRSSQNSLQSSLTNSQRPSSAYYPPPVAPSSQRSNLHQSIPNLKSPPSTHRLHNEDNKIGPSPNVNQIYGQNPAQNQNFHNYPNQSSPYGNQQNYPANNYMQRHDEGVNKSYANSSYPGQNLKDVNTSYPSPTHNSTPNYSNNVQQPLHIHANGYRQDDRSYERYGTGSGLLREDFIRQSQGSRHEEMMRYPSTSNIRIAEAQIQQNRISDDKYPDMRTSKSEDVLKQHTLSHPNEMLRYASSGNIRAHESNKVEIPQLRQNPDHHSTSRLNNEQLELRHNSNLNLRGQAKMVEMGEELRRRQNRILSPSYLQHPNYPQGNVGMYQQQPHFSQQGGSYGNNAQNYNMQMAHNAQSLQNLSLSQQQPNYPHMSNSSGSGYHQQQQSMYHHQQASAQNMPTSPTYKSPPIAPKPAKKEEDIPELPPTSTHPLYIASVPEQPKGPFYATSTLGQHKAPRDPWAREEQERQQEVRREAARKWQELQIRELLALPHRTPQQEEQLRVLQLEIEFQRRAQEAAELDDDDTEKESPSPSIPEPIMNEPPVSIPSTSAAVSSKPDTTPMSILKPGASNSSNTPTSQHQQQQQQESTSSAIVPPPPPERGSSFTVMSMRTKENTKRVSFHDTSSIQQPPNTLQIDETIREDPNSFIRQAESMLASPTTPTGQSPGAAIATPGVIGAQEVYRDPRTKRLAEQAQQKNLTTPVPEKLSFKEKMKMFAMETGEQETPKDKSKISRAQRDIDNLGSPSSGLVH